MMGAGSTTSHSRQKCLKSTHLSKTTCDGPVVSSVSRPSRVFLYLLDQRGSLQHS